MYAIIASSLSLNSLYRQLHWSYYISGTRSTSQLARIELVLVPHTHTSQTKFERNRCLFHCLVQWRFSLKNLKFFRVGTYHPRMLNEECTKAIIPSYFEAIVETPHIEILGNQFQMLSYWRRGRWPFWSIPLGSHNAQSGFLGMLKWFFSLITYSFCILTSIPGFEITIFINCNSDDIINNPMAGIVCGPTCPQMHDIISCIT